MSIGPADTPNPRAPEERYVSSSAYLTQILKSQRGNSLYTSTPLRDSINMLLHDILRRKFDEQPRAGHKY